LLSFVIGLAAAVTLLWFHCPVAVLRHQLIWYSVICWVAPSVWWDSC